MNLMTVKLQSWLAAAVLAFAAIPLAAQTPVPPQPVQPPLPSVPRAVVTPAPFPPQMTSPSVRYEKANPLGSVDILNALQVGRGVWWNDDAMIASLGLTTTQRRKMDEIFQQYRLQLIDLNAALDKEELILQPLVAAETLDEAKIIAQIDRVAASRAELEKANARLLLGLHQTLTADQRAKLPRNQQQPAKFRPF